MLRLGVSILALGICTGSTTPPHQSQSVVPPVPQRKRLPHRFSIRTSREVREKLKDSWLLVSASRPNWAWSADISRPAGRAASSFEHSHPDATVEECDVYWTGHNYPPIRYQGIRLNSYYFDRNEMLIGSEWSDF